MPKQNIFLSSPDPQSDALADFRQQLMRDGFKIFTNDGISPDSDLARREIGIADVVVIGLTHTQSDSDRFDKEITNAIEQSKRLIVVKLEPVEIPTRLQDFAIIDLTEHPETGLQLVEIAMSGKMGASIKPVAKGWQLDAPKRLSTAPSRPTTPKPIESPPHRIQARCYPCG